VNTELSLLLILLAISLPIGLLGGIVTRKLRPDWCKSYTKYCLDGKWPIYAFGIVMFLGLSITAFLVGRPYFGILFALFIPLEALALIKHGFNSLTPEMEAKIDASDPTRLWPVKFWKKRGGGRNNIAS